MTPDSFYLSLHSAQEFHSAQIKNYGPESAQSGHAPLARVSGYAAFPLAKMAE